MLKPSFVTRARSLARRLARDERGVSAVEFAFILPIMVLLYLGLAEITLSMMAERRASHAASAVGDLVAQNRVANIARADVDRIFFVGVSSLRPFPAGELSMRVTSVQADANKIPRVIWSRSHGPSLSKLNRNDPVAGFPANLLAAGESVVLSETTYSYENPLMKVIPRSLVFQDKFYLRPRRVPLITCTDCPA